MRCRNCKHKFCWLCLKDWDLHSDKTGGWYACQMYEELRHTEDYRKSEKIMNNSKKEIEKY